MTTSYTCRLTKIIFLVDFLSNFNQQISRKNSRSKNFLFQFVDWFNQSSPINQSISIFFNPSPTSFLSLFLLETNKQYIPLEIGFGTKNISKKWLKLAKNQQKTSKIEQKSFKISKKLAKLNKNHSKSSKNRMNFRNYPKIQKNFRRPPQSETKIAWKLVKI